MTGSPSTGSPIRQPVEPPPDRQAAAERLRAQGLVSDNAPLPALTAERLAPVPLALQFAIGLGAWVASLLLFSFIGATALAVLAAMDIDGPTLYLIAGAPLSVLAVVVNRGRNPRASPGAAGLFRDHLMLVAGLLGLTLLVFATIEFEFGFTERALAGLAVTVTLIVVNQDSLFRFVASLVALALAGYVLERHLGAVALPPFLIAPVLLVWLGQGQWSRLGWDRLVTPVGTAATVFACAAGLAVTMSRQWAWFDRAPLLGASLQLSIALACVVTAAVLFGRQAAARGGAGPIGSLTAVAIVLAAGWCLWRSPMVAGCLMLWVLGLACGHRRIAGLALLVLAVQLGLDYYALDTTLMSKGLRLLELAAAAALLPLAQGWARRHRPGIAGAGEDDGR